MLLPITLVSVVEALAKMQTKFDVSLKDLVFPARTYRKLETYMKIMFELPATFTVLQERTKLSPSILDKYLKALIDLKIVRKEHNLYRFNVGILEDWMKNAGFKDRILLAIMYNVPLKFRFKTLKKEEIKKYTLAQVLAKEKKT